MALLSDDLPRRFAADADERGHVLAEVWTLSGRMERAQAEWADKIVLARRLPAEPPARRKASTSRARQSRHA